MENEEMTNDAAVAWNVLEIGNRGAAYDLPWVKRAFTYDHQPGNVDASKLGRAANTAVHMSAGDSIDRGLALLRTLQDEGFGVFQIGPELAQDATTVAELRARVSELTADRDSWMDQASERVRNWHEEHEARKAAERRVAELEAAMRSAIALTKESP